MKFGVKPADVPADQAARRIGLTLAQFENVKMRLFDRGFPQPDVDTGNYDLDAIDAWRRARHPHLFTDARPAALTTPRPLRDARENLGARRRG